MNNSIFGFTVQKTICDLYGITPKSERAINYFKENYDSSISLRVKGVLADIFDEIGQEPIECLTMAEEGGKPILYNFKLSDGSSLSIRTNEKSCKVAPRVVGQAGFKQLNDSFGDIYGKPIENQSDIKLLMVNQIDEVLPIFVSYFFDADRIVWMYEENDSINYSIIDGNKTLAIEYNKSDFSFTRGLSEWVESTTLKWDGISIAEIQVHKKRSFKFRFFMKNIIALLTNKTKTTETLGITAEKAVCDLFSLDFPEEYRDRCDDKLERDMMSTIKQAFNELPKAISYEGNKQGIRGGNSKSSYDFVLEGNKTLSLKTNMRDMVCPPEVGQPCRATAHEYFKALTGEDHMDASIFKDLAFNKIEELITIYLDHLFDSDYLLRIKQTGPNTYCYQILGKEYATKAKFKRDDFTFSQTRDSWNESNTLYCKGKKFGEFQIHKNRDSLKFRFQFDNMVQIIDDWASKNQQA